MPTYDVEELECEHIELRSKPSFTQLVEDLDDTPLPGPAMAVVLTVAVWAACTLSVLGLCSIALFITTTF